MLYAVCHPKLQGCTALHCTTIPRLHLWLGWVAVGAVVVVVDLLLCDCAAACIGTADGVCCVHRRCMGWDVPWWWVQYRCGT